MEAIAAATATAATMAIRRRNTNSSTTIGASTSTAKINPNMGSKTTPRGGAVAVCFASFDTNKTSQCYTKPVSKIKRH